MPAPSSVAVAGRETDWLSNLKMQFVEAIPAAPYASKESTLLIPYVQHTSPDQQARVALVELTDADDRVPQARDVVDAVEGLVFAVPASEDDTVPMPLISTTEPSPNLTVPVTVWSSSAKASLWPVM